MKKLAIVLLLLALTVSAAFAQKTVDELNGFDWVTWSFDAKVGFIRGFYAAYISIMNFAVYTNQDNPKADEVLKSVENQFYIPLTIGELGQKVDEFYSDYKRRELTLWQVVVYLSGKAWWQ